MGFWNDVWVFDAAIKSEHLNDKCDIKHFFKLLFIILWLLIQAFLVDTHQVVLAIVILELLIFNSADY